MDYRKLHSENPDDRKLENYKPFFRRALYTVGLLLRHFDLDKETVRCGLPVSICNIANISTKKFLITITKDSNETMSCFKFNIFR